MKHKIIISLMAVGIGLAGLLSACGSKNEYASLMTGGEAYLEVEVSGINPSSRDVIIGDTIPNWSKYGICPMLASSMNWIDNDSNVVVNFIEGKSIIEKDIAIPENQEVAVYAYYPFKTGTNLNYLYIEAGSQTDYLWGRSEDANGNLMYVTTSQPKATIRFEHIMARITLRVYRDTDNSESYNIPSIALRNGSPKGLLVDVITKKTVYVELDKDITEIHCALSGNWLNESNEMIVADLLVLPFHKSHTLCFNFDNGTAKYIELPDQMYESGKQYIYDCKIKESGTLEISDVSVNPWDATDGGSIIIKP